LSGSEAATSFVPATGQVIDHFPFVVGRTPSSQEQRPISDVDLCLNDVVLYRLSRAHFAIQWQGEKIIVRDLNTHLGTKVNDTYIGHHAPRDIVELRPGENLIVAGGDGSPFILRVVVSN
jgi:hypothetical protein